jgi:exonuclease SbcC
MTKITFKKLVLENFKIHQEFEIDLNQNKLYLVVGKNGSGKTSIIDGIFWCLYDETVKGQKGDSIVNNKAGKNCSAILQFDVDGVEYEIRNYRKHSKFKNTKILLRNGEQISTDADIKSTNDIINNIVMTKDLFSNCMLFSQFVKEPFLSRTHSGQKEILDKMLSLEKYDEYYEKINESITQTKSDLLNLENKNSHNLNIFNIHTGNVEKLSNELIEKKNQSNEKIKLNTDTINTYKNQQKEIEPHLNNFKELSIQFPLVNDKYNLYVKDKENIDTSLNADKVKLDSDYRELFTNKSSEIKDKFSQDKLKHLENKEKYTQKFNDYKSKYDQMTYKTLEEINKINNNIEIELNNIDKQIIQDKTNILEEFREIQTKYNEDKIEYNNKLSQSKNELTNYINSIENIENEIKKLTESKVCITCKREFDKNTAKTIEDKINSLKNDIYETENKIGNVNNEISVYENKLKDMFDNITTIDRDYKERIRTVESNYNKNDIKEKYNSELLGLKDKLSKEQENFNNNETKYNTNIELINNKVSTIDVDTEDAIKIEKEKISENYKIDLNKLKDKYSKLNTTADELIVTTYAELNSLETKLAECENYKNLYDEITNKINMVISNNNQIEEHYKEDEKLYNKRIGEIKIDINTIENEMRTYINNCDALDEKMQILKFWKEGFSDIGIKSILLDESIPILNQKARELSQCVNNIRVSFSSQTTLKSGKSNNKFNIDAIHTTNLSEYSDFSAGETRLANIIILLSLRYLLETMSGKKTNILLLDEILDSLDEDNASVIAGIFEKLSSEYFVILISHTQKEWIQYDEELRL